VATRGPHEQNDLDQKMIQKLRSAFKQSDRDGSGTISTGGAYHALSMIFPTYTLPNFEDTLERESIRGAGKDKVVDLDEFECIAKKLYNIRKVYSEFRQYDKNHDLKMDRKELERALTQFYFKNVAKPGLIQTVMIRQQVKKTVDNIIKRHDKNHDQQVSWHEFEMDAFMEEHYNLGAKCRSSKTPLNRHEVNVVENLIRKFTRHGNKKQLSHSEWYQIASMLTEQEIDKANGAAKPPALGCRTTPEQESHQKHHGFGPGTKGKGRERVLLRRFLQKQTIKNRKFMSLMETLHELHKQADSNRDGHISDHEILDIFQGVRDHLSTSDFGGFLDLVNKLHGPINCGKYHDCGHCTLVGNAGLCGWFAESSRGSSNPFGGVVRKSSGSCKFVDRSMAGGRSADTYKTVTCSTQCKKKKKPTHGSGSHSWHRGSGSGRAPPRGRGSGSGRGRHPILPRE